MIEKAEKLKKEDINAFEENFEVESENEVTVKTNPASFQPTRLIKSRNQNPQVLSEQIQNPNKAKPVNKSKAVAFSESRVSNHEHNTHSPTQNPQSPCQSSQGTSHKLYK